MTIDVNHVIESLREGLSHEVTTPDGRRFVVHHENLKLSEITDPAWRPALPETIEQAVTLTTKDSLVEYVTDFGLKTARLFLDVDKARVTAWLDYHQAGTTPVDNVDEVGVAPGEKRHWAILHLRESEEWARWTKISGKLMPQGEFARFIEENAADVAAPSGADLLEVVRDLHAVRNADFRSAVRLDNGDVSLEWTEETTAKTKTGGVELPRLFKLFIPLFYGEPSAEVFAHLRYRIEGGALAIGVELHRPVFVRLAALEQIGRELRERTRFPLHYGEAFGLRGPV